MGVGPSYVDCALGIGCPNSDISLTRHNDLAITQILRRDCERNRRDQHTWRQFLSVADGDAEISDLAIEPRGIHGNRRGRNPAGDGHIGYVAGGQCRSAGKHVVESEREAVVLVWQWLSIGSGKRTLETDAVGAGLGMGG